MDAQKEKELIIESIELEIRIKEFRNKVKEALFRGQLTAEQAGELLTDILNAKD